MSNMHTMPEDLETRTVLTPRTGTKICILIGLAFLVVAAYFYFTPVTSVRTTTGSIFGCGSAAHPPSSTFTKNTCGGTVDAERYRAFASGGIGILTIVLGAVMFGVDRRTETHRVTRTADDFDDRRHRFGDEDRRRRDDDEGDGSAADDRAQDGTRRDRRSRHHREWDDDRG